jgi:glycosyltransferase involved in cell wall biosynthesis
MNPYNKKLAIAIPTYNRAEIIEENLQRMLPELRLHAIPVYISDDSTDLKTAAAITRLQLQYEHIFYRHNQPGLGHDRNFFATLAMPDCDYVWYLGDSLYIQRGVISEIIEVLDGTVDFCFVNGHVDDESSRYLASAHDFLVERTWYLTLTGATIYGRKPRALMPSAERISHWRNFVQLGLVLEYCSAHTASMYWYGKPALHVNKNKKTSYWANNALEVFVGDWARLVRSFSGYFSESELNAVIKSHALNSKLFSFKHLIFLRQHDGLNLALLQKYKVDFFVASPINPIWAYLIALFPMNLCRYVVACGRIFRGN